MRMNRFVSLLLMAPLLAVPQFLAAQQKEVQFDAPPQDQGLPYTRSARPRALKAVESSIAVFGGSRYAYLYGYKVRLDDVNMLHAEAIYQNDRVYAPLAFASAFALRSFQPKLGPSYLASKWVYSFDRKQIEIPTSIPTISVKGKVYLSLGDLARSLGMNVFQTKRGLLLASYSPIPYDDKDAVLSDDVATLFDTPEKLADPEILIRWVPLPHSQGHWYDHASATPEQRRQLEQPEVDFPLTPLSEYDLTGFNATLLGSKVPPPGVWPRVLFSPEDVPMLAAHVKQSKFAQMSMIEIEEQFKHSWWDASTSDGKLFNKLAKGDISDLKFDNGNIVGPFPPYAAGHNFVGYKPMLYNTHISYITNALVTMSLYALLTNDDALGHKCAGAVSNYYKLLEPALDTATSYSNSEFGTSHAFAEGAEDSFSGLHALVAHMDLGLSLDFAGKWMTPDQVEIMRRFIAKATYGRRIIGGEAPSRWRDNNHDTWHTTNILAQAAIEGLEGYDPEVYANGVEAVRSFLEFGIDKNGQIFESNGKNGGGFQYLVLNLISMARRGDNMFGHPHLRKMTTSEVYNTAPDGKVTLSGGSWGGSNFAPQSIAELAAFFPSDRAADVLLTNAYPDLDLRKLDLNAFRADAAKKWNHTRLPGPTYPNFVRAFPYCKDFVPTTRGEINLPLDRNDPVHGMFTSFSDQKQTATWIDFNVRPNHYIGSGHHHADAGLFYIAGEGVDWITESPFQLTYDGRLHNEVLIDGISEANGPPARAKYLGATLDPAADFAAADLSYAYSWQWTTQVLDWSHTWPEHTPEPAHWELEPDLEIIAIFQGTERYKDRIWWDTYNFANFIPTLRAPWNPVEYVYRTVGLVRGKHPFVVIADDAKKDEKDHLYQWTAQLNKGITDAQLAGTTAQDMVLAQKSDLKGKQVAVGAPILLLHLVAPESGATLRAETMTDGPMDKKGNPQSYDRVSASLTAKSVRYRVLAIAMHEGEPLPTFTSSADGSGLTIRWPDETRRLSFAIDSNRTRVAVKTETGEVVAP
jgi:hypothetical protein